MRALLILSLISMQVTAAHARMTATASSEDNAEFTADRAVDGNMQTRWSSKFEDNQWLEIDLGDIRDISGLYIFWEAAYAKEYDVLVSTDREDWNTVHSTKDGKGGTDKLFFSARPVRYVKIDFLMRGTDWGNSIYEVQTRADAEAASDGGPRLIEDFESTDGWGEIKSQGAEFRLTTDRGPEDQALGMNFEFPSPIGYVVAGKDMDLSLPDDYKLSFIVKGEGRPNTLEFKLMDAAGNTYWKKFEDFEFPPDWKEITVRKKQIAFAWGPSGGGSIKDVRRIEFGVSCGQGGKGILLIDKLAITDLSAAKTRYSLTATGSTSEKDEFSASRAVDGDRGTRWASLFEDNQWLELDLGEPKEFVGMTIHWEAAHAKEYDVSISNDKENWTHVYSTTAGEGGVTDLYFKKRTARYIQIDCHKRATEWGNSIWEVELKGPEEEVHLKASSSTDDHPAEKALDGDLTTVWQSAASDSAWILCDLGRARDIGAMAISWDGDYARSYDVYFSSNLFQWDRRFSTRRGNGGRDRLVFKDLEARYVMIQGQEASGEQGFGIREIEVKGAEFSGDKNTFYEITAEEAPRGFYPKYFSKQQSYWTVVGVSEDQEEALINEEGAFEVGREQFSVEPFLHVNGRLITWADVTVSQALEKEYLPIPRVQWTHPEAGLTVKLFAHGPAGASSIYAGYQITNPTSGRLQGKLFLAIRPFQVNPPWQTLNQKGGVAKISRIEYDGARVTVNANKKILPLIQPAGFGAVSSAAGDITDFLQNGQIPAGRTAADEEGLASGALEFPFDLEAGESAWVYLAVPFHDILPDVEPNATPARASEVFQSRLAEMAAWWDDRLSRVVFHVPEKAKKFVNTLKSNLAYIFINRDGYRIQPGSRSYLRSWIRDGAMTSSAILRMGNIKEVKEYLTWYAPNIFPDGRVPCVVDDRGADGTPENDSNGEFIYAFLQYYHFTHDKEFLREHFSRISKAADFIIEMRNQRKTDEYKTGAAEKRVLYGLVPESISHEGYSSKPAHSHWDNFFSLKGLKDAATICEILGEPDLSAKYRAEAEDFRTCILQSIQQTQKNHNIDFIPGAADLGDFDATSTSIAIFPCGELYHLPTAALNATFDRYYADLEKRMAPGANWGDAYTPYEIRTCRTFMIMGQRDRSKTLFEFLFADQRPAAWNHWAEVVWRLPETPRFIGDMPHTWIGSDYMNTVRSMFVYEQEEERALVLGAGIFEDWLEDGVEVGVEHAPTYWGEVNYIMKRSGDALHVRVWGDAAPPGKIYVRPPVDAPIRSVQVDPPPEAGSGFEPPRADPKGCKTCPGARPSWAARDARIERLPAEVTIRF